MVVSAWSVVMVSTVVVLATCIGSILLATGLSHTAWWRRRKRLSRYYSDKGRQQEMLCRIIETLSITSNSTGGGPGSQAGTAFSSGPMTNSAMIMEQGAFYKNSHLERQIPLRFQPEKLYGTTSNTHHYRDSSRLVRGTVGGNNDSQTQPQRKSFCTMLGTGDLLSVPQKLRSRSGSAVSIVSVASSRDESPPATSTNRPATVRATSSSRSFLQVPQSVDFASDDSVGEEEDSTGCAKLSLNVPQILRRASSSAIPHNSAGAATAGLITKSSGALQTAASAGNSPKIMSPSASPRPHPLKFQKSRSRRASISSFVLSGKVTGEEQTAGGLAALGQAPAMIARSMVGKQADAGPLLDYTTRPMVHFSWECEASPSDQNLWFVRVRLGALQNLPSNRPWTTGLIYTQAAIVFNGENVCDRSTETMQTVFGAADFKQHHCPTLELQCVLPRSGADSCCCKLIVVVWDVVLKSVVALREEEITGASLKSHQAGSSLLKCEWHSLTPALPLFELRGDLLVSLNLRESSIQVGIYELRNLRFKFPHHHNHQSSLIQEDHASSKRQFTVRLRACLVNKKKIVRTRKGFTIKMPLPEEKKGIGLPLAEGQDAHEGIKLNSQKDCLVQFNLNSASSQQDRADFSVVLFLVATWSGDESFSTEASESIRAIGHCFIGNQRHAHSNISPMATSLWDQAFNHHGYKAIQWLCLE